MTTNNTKQTSFPFLGVLALISITLKLTGNIDWSWWWVLAPLWIPISLVIAIAILVLAVGDK